MPQKDNLIDRRKIIICNIFDDLSTCILQRIIKMAGEHHESSIHSMTVKEGMPAIKIVQIWRQHFRHRLHLNEREADQNF